jgi:organic radical activating enzyme
MKFAWDKYDELPCGRRNTLQIFVTNRCNLKCEGCFARKVMRADTENDIRLDEYYQVLEDFEKKGGEQINILGGEPLLHPNIREMVKINRDKKIKTTIYTNGYYLDRFKEGDLHGAKLRVSLYCKTKGVKSLEHLPLTNMPIDTCFMVSKKTTLNELLDSANDLEQNYNCGVFFISSIRELDNPRQEFFDDTSISMPMLEYKELVHNFLKEYDGNMEVHVSKRGVFESTKTLPDIKCRFANYFIGGKIIQCPYDIVNLKFQDDYSFDTRLCQQNSTCLMSKVIYKRRKK